MKYLLPLLFFPFLLQAQNDLSSSHTAVFFDHSKPREEQLALLRAYGNFDNNNLICFHDRPIVFVPNEGMNLAGLKEEGSVEHVAPVHMNERGEFVTYRNKLFVQLKRPEDRQVLENEASKLGLEVVGPNRFLNEIIELRTSRSGITTIEAVEQLRSTTLFGTIGPDLMHSVRDCSVDDPRFDRQWNLKNEGTGVQGNGTPGADIDAELAWDITTGSPNIKIAILDSGIDTLHADLLGKLLPGFDAMDDTVDTQGYPTPNYDSDGHGTACAGIAAANTNNTIGVAGVCPECRVIPVRVFQYQLILGEVQPWSSTEVFMNGISWMWQEGNADIASNSWGVPDFLLAFFPGGDSIVNLAIDAAVEQGRGGRGVPMLFSSGNDGVTDTIPLWPARYGKTIAVGATSMCDEHKSPTSCDGENWAGNWGEGLDVSAPGVRIPTTDMLGANGFHNTEYYNTFNGTSAACPNAAGVMGLILSEFPYLPAWAATNALKRGCEKVGGYDYSTWKESGSWSSELGYGRINAYNSLVYGAELGIDEPAESSIMVQTFADHHEISRAEQDVVSWELMDLSGRIVLSGNAAGKIQILHTGLSTGIYALSIRSIGTQRTLKLLVP